MRQNSFALSSLSAAEAAKNLLDLAEQLVAPGTGLLVAATDGQLLVVNKKAQALLPALAGEHLTLLQLLPAAGQAWLRALPQTKRFSCLLPQPGQADLLLTCSLVTTESQDLLSCALEKAPLPLPAPAGEMPQASYREIFENTLESICILDPEGRIVDLNQAALNYSDLPKAKVIGRKLGEVLDFNEFEETVFQKRLRQVLGGSQQKFDWWFKAYNQELVTAEIILKPGIYGGQPVVLAHAIDIYDLAHSEQNVRFRNNQLEFVNSLLTNLARYQTTEEILQFALDQLLEKTNTLGGGIYLYQEPEQQLSLLSAKGFQQDYVSQHPALPLNPEQVKQLNPEQILDMLQPLFQPLQLQLPVKSLVLLPVFSDQSFVGVFTLFLKSGRKITSSYISLIESISTGIGQYITKHELNRQLSFSESRYQVLFDSSSDAIILSNGEEILDFNRAVQQIGFPKNILHHKSLVSFLGNEKASEEKHLRHLLHKCTHKGQEVIFEWKHWQENQVVLETEISFNRVLINSQYFIQTIIRDITQKKQALAARRKEEALTESIRQFREMISKVELAYVSVDREGNIKYVNNYFLSLLGYSLQELIGQNYFVLFTPPEELEARLSGFHEIIQTATLKNQYEREIRTRSGEVKTLVWQRMFEYDAEGNITGLNSLGRDVSDKKAAIEALRDNKSRLQDIFDNAHDLIQNISVDNKFIFVNKAWKEKLGYDDFDIEKLTLNDIVHPYYKAKLIYQLRNLYKGEHVNKIETVFLTKAGKPVHLIGSINCTYQNGKPVASRAILHDITDRIKAERLQKVYYSIANLAISSKDLSSLYGAIHRELSKIIETNNIFIALTDEEKNRLNFVYFVDQYKEEGEFVSDRHFSNGISEYIINTGKPLFLLKEDILKLIAEGAISQIGTMPEVILCSPLAVGDRIIGVIAVQDYRKQDAYVSSDIEILHFISNQVALAIERKRNEVRINNQNARLKAIFESGSHLMWSINRQGQLTSFNQNFAQAYQTRIGHDPQVNEQVVQETPNLPDHDEWHTWDDNFRLAMGGQARRFEIRLPLADGSAIWQEVLLNPIYLEDNSFEEVSAMALDITEKKVSQLAMAQSEEKFRSIFESFQDVFFRTDLQGRLTLVSPSAYEFLGISAEELQGLPLASLYQDPGDHDRLLERLDSQGKVRNFEARIKCRDNQVKDVLFNSSYVLDKGGQITGIEGVVRDITDMKQIQLELIRAKELAEHSSQAKTQFLANMSHELRTPMNGIIGMIDLLYHSLTSEEQREYIDTLRKSSDALLAILNDILDLSKIQAGKLVLHESGIDLHYTVQKIYSLFINRANQKDLALSYQITPHTPRFIISDETRLLQVLSNLTSNAIKFTNAGRVHIQVNSIRADEGWHTIMFQVKDSGIGISEDDKKLLFTNFTQLDNSSTKSFSGTGLGLAISKQLSELLGGDIGVDSVAGAGSTFWFTIRCQLAINGEEILVKQKVRDTEAEVQAFDFSPEVLLVDDNTINQKVAQQLLLKLGCKTDIASNGYEAIEKASQHRYDIIFMDIQMPEMDGVTATSRIKAILGDSCPPIVAMTAYSMKDDAEKFLSQGLDDYISKPVKASNLHAVISQWLRPGEGENNALPADDTEISDIFIDENVIQQLQQLGGAEFTRQLYEEFEEETAPLLAEARQEVARQHYEEILSTLHQIKGTGFTLGLNSIAEMAKKLEHAIRQQDFSQVQEDFAVLLDHFEKFKIGYPKKFTLN